VPRKWKDNEVAIFSSIIGLLNLSGCELETREFSVEVLVVGVSFDHLRQPIDAALGSIQLAFADKTPDLLQYVFVHHIQILSDQLSDLTAVVTIRVRPLPLGVLAFTGTPCMKVRRGSHAFPTSPVSLVRALQRCNWSSSSLPIAVAIIPSSDTNFIIDSTPWGTIDAETDELEFKRQGKFQTDEVVATKICTVVLPYINRSSDRKKFTLWLGVTDKGVVKGVAAAHPDGLDIRITEHVNRKLWSVYPKLPANAIKITVHMLPNAPATVRYAEEPTPVSDDMEVDGLREDGFLAMNASSEFVWLDEKKFVSITDDAPEFTLVTKCLVEVSIDPTAMVFSPAYMQTGPSANVRHKFWTCRNDNTDSEGTEFEEAHPLALWWRCSQPVNFDFYFPRGMWSWCRMDIVLDPSLKSRLDIRLDHEHPRIAFGLLLFVVADIPRALAPNEVAGVFASIDRVLVAASGMRTDPRLVVFGSVARVSHELAMTLQERFSRCTVLSVRPVCDLDVKAPPVQLSLQLPFLVQPPQSDRFKAALSGSLQPSQLRGLAIYRRQEDVILQELHRIMQGTATERIIRVNGSYRYTGVSMLLWRIAERLESSGCVVHYSCDLITSAHVKDITAAARTNKIWHVVIVDSPALQEVVVDRKVPVLFIGTVKETAQDCHIIADPWLTNDREVNAMKDLFSSVYPDRKEHFTQHVPSVRPHLWHFLFVANGIPPQRVTEAVREAWVTCNVQGQQFLALLALVRLFVPSLESRRDVDWLSRRHLISPSAWWLCAGEANWRPRVWNDHVAYVILSEANILTGGEHYWPFDEGDSASAIDVQQSATLTADNLIDGFVDVRIARSHTTLFQTLTNPDNCIHQVVSFLFGLRSFEIPVQDFVQPVLLDRPVVDGLISDFSPMVSLLMRSRCSFLAIDSFICELERSFLNSSAAVHVLSLRARVHRDYKKFQVACDLAQQAVEKAAGKEDDRMTRNLHGTILLRRWSHGRHRHAAEGDHVLTILYNEIKDDPPQQLRTAEAAITSLRARLAPDVSKSGDEEAAAAAVMLQKWLQRAELVSVPSSICTIPSRALDV